MLPSGLSGDDFGWYLAAVLDTFRYLFENDFEEGLVFVRCANSVSTPVLFLPCYRHGRWHSTLQYAHMLAFLPRFHTMATCHVILLLLLPLVCTFVFRVSKFRLFRSLACLSSFRVCMRACLRTLADWGRDVEHAVCKYVGGIVTWLCSVSCAMGNQARPKRARRF